MDIVTVKADFNHVTHTRGIATGQQGGHQIPTCVREALPKWKRATGEPYAGKPPVRFRGRGGAKAFPTPMCVREGVCQRGESPRHMEPYHV